MIHYYHPNKAITGSACSISYAVKGDEDFIFLTILKQAKAIGQQGIFKDSTSDPEKRVDIKLGWTEAAGIIDSVETNREVKAFHENKGVTKSVTFTPWMNGETQRGFSLSIVKKENDQSNSFYIGLTFAEAREIKEFLSHCLRKHFEFTINKNTFVERE